ncbi:N-acylneuraminate cytidylyltransferase A [Stomoxys calcitrans]|uniref:N-acylneuraminate cytidylyltransferase A n=1 Tax=Stomoxys calcitrans TaxID=35570 RepID=UPI0027E2B49E|nr:N-acylneuraminate cytidylyltransferase A [Stomoxys calcitrans]
MNTPPLKMFVTLFIWLSIYECCSIYDTHAIILARGGSKGIRNKNLLPFNGTTLLGHIIQIVKETKKFSAIWISTDSENIEGEAIKHGALVYKRMPYFAQDSSTSVEAIKEFLYKNKFVKKFALFQCTSVFLKPSYIKEAVKKFRIHPCVFAVKRSHKLRWKELNHQMLTPLNFNPKRRPRRQDWKGELEETGMFYFSNRNLIYQNLLQNDWCAVVEIETRDSIEIDSLIDYQIAQCIMKN